VGLAVTATFASAAAKVWSATLDALLEVSSCALQWMKLVCVSVALVHVSVSGVVDHSGCAAVQMLVFVALVLISTPVPAAAHTAAMGVLDL
jgi:hypothetical protein